MLNIEFPEAPKRTIDLLYSNVRGDTFSSGNSILMQRERGAKKETLTKKTKVRAVGKIGGAEAGMSAGRCLI